MANETVRLLRPHEKTNAICAIHRLHGRLEAASHEVRRVSFGRYFVCAFHAERKLLVARVAREAIIRPGPLSVEVQP